jgi:CubicO group peptidase (beta-lactamase class C family)
VTDLQQWLDEQVATLAGEAGVPGLVAGIVQRDQRAVSTYGVTSLDTLVDVTRDTVFQIGSNTKLYTATAAMRLVDEGRLGLDTRVVDLVPELRLATSGAAEQITVRHLLTHTSGIDGDVTGPADIGWGEDMLTRYVAALADVSLLHPVGAMWSYCNSGWVLLGHVIERATGTTYEQALRELVLEPLGARRTLFRAEEILLHRAAVGHVPTGPDGSDVVAPVYVQFPACAPAGSVMVSTADEVLDFVELHLDGGRGILKPDTAQLMTSRQVDKPRTRGTHSMGLGWMLGTTRDGRDVIGHGGGTLGQLSVLQVLPAERLAVVVLSNSLAGGMAGTRLAELAMQHLAGADISDAPPVPQGPPPADLTAYAGTYARRTTTVTVRPGAGLLELGVVEDPMYPDLHLPPRTLSVRPLDRHLFVDDVSGMTVRFDDFDQAGRPTYFYNFRYLRRTDAPAL